mmetsp:Transcript_5202/g.9151  ORF Transcript_5202/g.9151 Transcript_5202/m.9151 type:complete len:430 (-) Transcript_5202:76-1365(-)|eukprot:CAMPEP_0203784104 /NCGR_PEP_ID=MMETSP0100_2-20121128/277_1 /ASSEMBLY_ACC=CAM_ASM_000210 /TAXON_ID=96639 /ORGANISM=" , Strain NY0313808BC1" /LENGTH=429 /DNA_ID=CAMNT_0050686041 /DNA_START=496 /DNA_END=1785 /DNA_ORIENTATION=+
MDRTVVVVDPGGSTFKYGLSGDSSPRIDIPSCVGLASSKPQDAVAETLVGSVRLSEYREDYVDVQIKPTVVRGKIVDWDGFESLLRFAEDGIDCSGDGKMYMLADGVELDSKGREKAAQVFFEKFGASGVFVSKCAPLCLYANGRTTGIVLDTGGDLSSASVVMDGFLVKNSVKVSSVAGKKLSEVMLERLENDKIKIAPRFTFSKKLNRDGTEKVTYADAPCHVSYMRYWKLALMDEMKQDICKVSPVPLNPRPVNGKGNKKAAVKPQEPAEQDPIEKQKDEAREYSLPDGTVISAAGRLGRSIGEILLDPSGLGRPEINTGLSALVFASSQAISNGEQRRDILANLVLCGGTSLVPGLVERLAVEVASKMRGQKSRVIVSSPESRKYSSWIGGSIFGTLSSSAIGEVWVSKSEYEDQGPRIVSKKCP